jgi:hypothetical protein
MKPVMIFTPSAIERIKAMKLAGVGTKEIAAAIGCKSANALRARCHQLGVFRQKPDEAAAAA